MKRVDRTSFHIENYGGNEMAPAVNCMLARSDLYGKMIVIAFFFTYMYVYNSKFI